MLYDPSEFFSLYAWANVYQSRNKPAATQYFPVPKGQDPREVPAVGPPFEIPAIGISYEGFDATTVRGDYNAFTAGAEAVMHFDDFTLTYLPAATVYTDHDLRSIAGFPQTFDISIHTYTQELRATSALDSPLQWIGGLYWKKNIYTHDYVFGPYLGGARVPGEDTSYAAYGQLTYSVTEALRLTGGLRVSRDDKTAEDLTSELALLGADALLEAIEQLEAGTCSWTVQDEAHATYAAKIAKSDVALLPGLTTRDALRRVRASTAQAPARLCVGGRCATVLELVRSDATLAPGAVSAARRSLSLGFSDGALEVLFVKPDGRGPMSGVDWARGARFDEDTTWDGAS
jgi:hypothetical protein